ncbi:MAG: aminotransferase class IV [Oscillatoria sp. PMC 1068.18]|nr:aminotransferase class IV [Oscillatoria sp. PMC 1076.18]MEC4990855.1 aminotransferase class IV [Oscillatoria sp. PMC 1068.18]
MNQAVVNATQANYFWYNGELKNGTTLELNINEPGLVYGATVFTTLRVRERNLNHPLTNWDAHKSRLQHSLQTLGWQMPDWELLEQGAVALTEYYPILRVTVFPDGRELVSGRNLPPNLSQLQQQGITAWVAAAPQFNRELPNLKTGNYLASWLALEKARQIGAQEAILIDAAQNWRETATGNLWGWRDECWFTPPLSAGILPGITRSQIWEFLKRDNQKIVEKSWNEEFVKELDAIAYTNCAIELIPLHTVLTPNQTLHYNPAHPSLNYLKTCFHQS